MARKYFNDVEGTQLLQQYSIDETSAIRLSALSSTHYLSLGSVAALMKYAEIRL